MDVSANNTKSEIPVLISQIIKMIWNQIIN